MTARSPSWSGWWIALVTVVSALIIPRVLRSQTADNTRLRGRSSLRCSAILAQPLLPFPSGSSRRDAGRGNLGPGGTSVRAPECARSALGERCAALFSEDLTLDAGWSEINLECDRDSGASPWACFAIGRRARARGQLRDAPIPLARACSAGVIDACEELTASFDVANPETEVAFEQRELDSIADAFDHAECWFSEACRLRSNSPACSATFAIRTARYRLGCFQGALMLDGGTADAADILGPCRGLARSLESPVAALPRNRLPDSGMVNGGSSEDATAPGPIVELPDSPLRTVNADLATLERACGVRPTADQCGQLGGDEACAILLSLLVRYQHEHVRCVPEWAQQRCNVEEVSPIREHQSTWSRTCAGVVRLASHGEFEVGSASNRSVGSAIQRICAAPRSPELTAECAERRQHTRLQSSTVRSNLRTNDRVDAPWLAFDGPLGFSSELRFAALSPLHSWFAASAGGGGRLRWYWFEMGFGADAQWRVELTRANSVEGHWFDLMFAIQPGFVIASSWPRRATAPRDFLWTISAGALLRGGPSLSFSLTTAWNADVGGYLRLSRHRSSNFGSGWGVELSLSGASWTNWNATGAARFVLYL